MKPSISVLIPMALGLALCGGCMTYTLYDGPHRPTGELAIVKLGAISGVDGGDLTYLTGHDLAVLPGRHALDVTRGRGQNAVVLCTLDVNLKAQHVYEAVVTPKSARDPAPPVVTLVDHTLEQIVARHPPLPQHKVQARSATLPPPRASTSSPKSAPRAPVLATPPPSAQPRQTSQPMDAAVLQKLRELRQMKDAGLLTREEYVRRGNRLIATP